MNNVLSSASSAYGYEGRMIFGGQLSELCSCLAEMTKLSEKLEQYATLHDAAPSALVDADVKFNSVLSNGSPHFLYRISGVLGLFSIGSVSGKTESQFDVNRTVQSNVKKLKMISLMTTVADMVLKPK